MTSVTVSESINAPAHRVFAVMSDIPNAASFIPTIKKIEVLSGDPANVGVGFTWKETRLMMGKLATETMTVTAFTPPHAYRVEAKSGGMHYVTNITVEATSATASRVTMTFSGTPLTFAGKLFSLVGFLFKGVLRKCLAEDLAAIKARSESSAK
jgi:carbon monoxide dehydrogenase subunit G